MLLYLRSKTFINALYTFNRPFLTSQCHYFFLIVDYYRNLISGLNAIIQSITIWYHNINCTVIYWSIRDLQFTEKIILKISKKIHKPIFFCLRIWTKVLLKNEKADSKNKNKRTLNYTFSFFHSWKTLSALNYRRHHLIYFWNL